MKRLIFAAVLFMLTSAASAFMPATGLWQIDSEATGQPGRGLTLEVENEILFLTYYGYDANGFNLFYSAAGKIVNGTFSADLLDVEGGTVIGGAYKPGVLNTSPGKVNVSFTSGKRGTLTLPGEAPKAISKYSFGYADGPDGLLGTWILTQVVGANAFSQVKTLTTKLGFASSEGNGIVTTATDDFRCEFTTSGSFAGTMFCSDNHATIAQGDSLYAVKFSGDRGTGIGYYYVSTSVLSPAVQAHALRTASKSGVKTGLNESTEASTMIANIQIDNAKKENVASSASSQVNFNTSQEDAELATALVSWAAEVRAKSHSGK